MDNDDYTAKMTELIELLRVIGNDTQQCEVKECKRRISSTITETLSAFSNGNGGYIILGLSEKAGFTPVEGFNARAMQEALSQACEKLTPVVRPVIVTCPFEGANLVFAVIDDDAAAGEALLRLLGRPARRLLHPHRRRRPQDDLLRGRSSA